MEIALNPPAGTQDIPARFRYVAACLPEHPAVVEQGGVTSYASLNKRSDQLAAILAARSGSQAEPVAIFLPGSGLAALAILGILKAGKIYVPLDPGAQAGVQRKIILLSSARLLLTSSALLESARAVCGPQTSVLAVDLLDLDGNSEPPAPTLGPESTASINFTSGSTGQSKGIVWNHGAWVNRALLGLEYEGIGPADRIALLFSPAFSPFSALVFMALLNGATLYPYAESSLQSANLFAWMAEQAISAFFPPVDLLRARLADTNRLCPLPAVRVVVLGGQRFFYRDLRTLTKIISPDCVIANRLSMTEVHLVTRFVIPHQEIMTAEGAVPVGYPCTGSEVLLWDETENPTAPGETGQIVVRSRYLSPGYWNDPVLTAAKFRPDPQGSDQSLFLTGDLGRFRPDGCLEYFGRKDLMVKIRGYRVEPEAVELALLAHPALSECVVTPRLLPSGEQQLVAYLVTRDGARLAANQLRCFLAETLPAYSIPSRFVFLARLPVNTSGKVDRLALPPPGANRPDLDQAYTAPASKLEQQIAEIWAELLELDSVGIEDNFFDLGGDSISAIRMLLRIEEQTGPLQGAAAAFTRQPTIAALAGRQPAPPPPGPGKTRPQAAVLPRGGPGLRAKAGKMLEKIMAQGPALRGRSLPYGLGVGLQRALAGNPLVQRWLYPGQMDLVRRWQAELGRPANPQDLTISLLINTWHIFRLRALANAAARQGWVTMGGEGCQLLQTGPWTNGVVIASAHTSYTLSILQCCLQELGREATIITNKPLPGAEFSELRQMQVRTAQLWQARQVLRRNGLVLIAADGKHGLHPVDAQFWGRRRSFQSGAAELAVTTGALLLPVFGTLDVKGRVHFEVTAPLLPQPGPEEDQIRELTSQFAARYAALWPEFFASMQWDYLEYNLNLPKW